MRAGGAHTLYGDDAGAVEMADDVHQTQQEIFFITLGHVADGYPDLPGEYRCGFRDFPPSFGEVDDEAPRVFLFALPDDQPLLPERFDRVAYGGFGHIELRGQGAHLPVLGSLPQ